MEPTMESHNQEMRLILEIDAGEEIGEDALDMQTRNLRDELLELGVSAVELVHSKATPGGTKSAEAVTLGSLALVVLPSFLTKLVEYLQSWILRGENRRVKIKTQAGERSIEVDYSPTSLSPQELSRLVELLTGALGKQEIE